MSSKRRYQAALLALSALAALLAILPLGHSPTSARAQAIPAFPGGPASPANFATPVCTSAMTGTTSTVTVAAPGSGIHNYITAVIVTNSSSTVGTFVEMQDGSGGTVLWEGYAAGTPGGGFTQSFPVAPMRQPTANNGLYFVDVTTGANVIACATGFTGP